MRFLKFFHLKCFVMKVQILNEKSLSESQINLHKIDFLIYILFCLKVIIKYIFENPKRSMSNLNNYHNELDNANNFLNQIIFRIINKSKTTLNCLQYNNVTEINPGTLAPSQPVPPPSFAKSKDRPHECETCKKSFHTRDNLKMHLRSHDSGRPFSCELCHATFKFVMIFIVVTLVEKNIIFFPYLLIEKFT